MKQLQDFSDTRNKGGCFHCGQALSGRKVNREHIPTRSLLNKPYPDHLGTVEVHAKCNKAFSSDEEYLVAFLASVLSGSTEPDSERFPAAAGALRHSPKLRRRISLAQTVQATDPTKIEWKPEIKRINDVLVKNAKGHAFFELGEPMLAAPLFVRTVPFYLMSPTERDEFENGADSFSLWPEVGSRLLQRMAIGELQSDGWLEIQPEVYRFSVVQSPNEIQVRIVLREYLASEVVWDVRSIADSATFVELQDHDTEYRK